MSIPINSGLTPRTTGYALLEDIYQKGGYQTVADEAARLAIPDYNRKAGMAVGQVSDGTIWLLGNDLTTWTEFSGGVPSGSDGEVLAHVSGTPTFIPPSSLLATDSVAGFQSAADKFKIDVLGPINVLWHGLVNDGVTDNTAAFQTLINTYKTVTSDHRFGATFYLPAGKYIFNGQLAFNSTFGFRLLGDGSVTQSDYGMATTLVFTSAVTGSESDLLVDCRSSVGFTCDNLCIEYSNSGFVGRLFGFDHDDSASDAEYMLFRNCTLMGAPGGIQSARALISLNHAIIGWFQHCRFAYARCGIRGSESAGYSNSFVIADCTFDNILTDQLDGTFTSTAVLGAAIMNARENWIVRGCTFEGIGRMGRAYYADIGEIANISFRDCWFGDVTTNGTYWIEPGLGAINGFSLTGGIYYGSLRLSTTGGAGMNGVYIGGGAWIVGNIDFGPQAINGAFIGGCRYGGLLNQDNISNYNITILGDNKADIYCAPGRIDIAGHIYTNAGDDTLPTITVGVAAGASGTATLPFQNLSIPRAPNDASGKIQIVTDPTLTLTGTLATINFVKAYPIAPQVSPNFRDAATKTWAKDGLVIAATTTSITLTALSPPPVGTTLNIDYLVVC